MAYTAWSVVFGEQPTAAKWNILGTNDASFNDGTGIADDAILARHIANLAVSNAQMAADTWLWEKLADVTLGVAGDTIASGTFTARKYLKVYLYQVATGGTTIPVWRFNNDSGNNYTNRQSASGGADATATSQAQYQMSGAEAVTSFLAVFDILNLTSIEKVGNGHVVKAISTGAGTAPARTEDVIKWANTSAQITRLDVINSGGTGDFAIGSRLIVLGHD